MKINFFMHTPSHFSLLPFFFVFFLLFPYQSTIAKDVEVEINNMTDYDIDIIWINENKEENPVGSITPGFKGPLNASIDQVFLAKINGLQVGSHKVRGVLGERFIIGDLPEEGSGKAEGTQTKVIIGNFSKEGDVSLYVEVAFRSLPEIVVGTIVVGLSGSFPVITGSILRYKKNGKVVAQHKVTGRLNERFQYGEATFLEKQQMTAKLRGEVLSVMKKNQEKITTAKTKKKKNTGPTLTYYQGGNGQKMYLLNVENRTKTPVDLYWQGSIGGEWTEFFTLKPGYKGRVSAGGSGFKFRFLLNGKAVDQYTVSEPEQHFIFYGDLLKPQLVSNGGSADLIPGVRALTPTSKEFGGFLQFYNMASSNIVLKQSLPDNQSAQLTIRANASAYFIDDKQSLAVRLQTIDGTSLTLLKNEKPTLSSEQESSKIFFLGNFKMTVSPLNAGLFVNTKFPVNKASYTSISSTESENSSVSVSCNASVMGGGPLGGGAMPSVGCGPAASIGKSSSQTVSKSVGQYVPTGSSSGGIVYYEWDSCGISNKSETTDDCSYRNPKDIYDEKTASLRTLDKISLDFPAISTDTIFHLNVSEQIPLRDMPDSLRFLINFTARFDRVWLEKKNDNATEFGSGFALVFRPDQWGSEKSPAYIKHANQNVKEEQVERNFQLILTLGMQRMKSQIN